MKANRTILIPIGEQKNNRIEWELGKMVKVDPGLSSRRLCEPTIAELYDGVSFDDYAASFTKYQVESLEDIEKLKYVLLPPNEETIKKDIEANREIFSLAEKYQL